MQLAIDLSPCSRGSVSSTSSPWSSSTRPPEVYTRDEVQQQLDGPFGRNERTWTRNRALRCGEGRATSLGSRGWTQSRSRRWVHGSSFRGELGLDPGGPVFCIFTGNAVESSYVRHMCRRLRSKLGLFRRVHAHALRHTHAHELLREGVAENLIQVQLGHVSLESMDNEYLRKVVANETVAVVRERGWSL